MKKIIVCFALMIFVLYGVCFRVNAFTESGECGDGVFWQLDSETETLRIYGSGVMIDYVEHKTKYDSTQAPWSIYVYRIKSIVVEEGVTYIGSYAFYKCIYASSVTLPESLEEIGPHAFEKCVSIEKMNLTTADRIGEYAFAGCKKLVGYTLKDSAVCAENAFDGAGKSTVGCGGTVLGAAPIFLLCAAAYVISKRNKRI